MNVNASSVVGWTKANLGVVFHTRHATRFVSVHEGRKTQLLSPDEGTKTNHGGLFTLSCVRRCVTPDVDG